MNMAPKNCTFLIFLAYYDYTKSIVAQKKKLSMMMMMMFFSTVDSALCHFDPYE